MQSAAMTRAERAGHDPQLGPLRDLYVIPHNGLSAADSMIVQCLQGLNASQSARVWQRHGSFYAIAEAQMKAEGVRIHEVATVWDLLNQFRGSVKGAVLYRLGTPSLNVATSLCGAMGAVAIDESLRDKAEAVGLKVLADVRDMDEEAAYARYRKLFGRGVLVEQGLDKPGNLRDFAVAHRAFTFATKNREFRRKVVRELGPHAILWGWGPDEFEWVEDVSRADATGGPADWCTQSLCSRNAACRKTEAPYEALRTSRGRRPLRSLRDERRRQRAVDVR